MIILKRFCRNFFIFTQQSHGFRRFSTKTDSSVLVYRSLSKDPYVNLGFEDWMYENLNLELHRTVLFLWRNEPTVVIGRHQNPWKECNLQLMKSLGINLARRNSGGGTVYHDLGNINCTFFTNRIAYNRKNNLELLARFLKDFYGFNISLNERDDLIVDSKYKVSGTAAKLGLRKAYHHCTILCKVDTAKLNEVLQPSYSGIFSNATMSVRSDIKNLFEDSRYDWQEITSNLARFFIEENVVSGKDFNWNKHMVDVDPLAHEQSSDILKRRHKMLNWDWKYGKTPKFIYVIEHDFSFGRAKLTLTIKNGIVVESAVDCNESKEKISVSSLTKELLGTRFNRPDVLMTLCQSLSSRTLNYDHDEGQILKEVSEHIISSIH